MDSDTTRTSAEVPAQRAYGVSIDDFAAPYDYGAIAHRVVNAPPSVTYSAARHQDLLSIHSRLAGTAMWVRGLPDRLQRRLPLRVPTRLTFDDLVARGRWVLLGENPGREVVFGVVGRFWTPKVRWEYISAEEFAGYHEPNRGKIAVALSVRAYGNGRSLLTYEVRMVLTDPRARRWFGWYWRTVRPFVTLVMRATLGAIAAHAEVDRDQ